VNDANSSYFFARGELTVVKPNLGTFEGVDIHPQDVVFLCLVPEDKVRPLCLLNDELGNLATLGRILLAKEVLDRVQIVLAHCLVICVIHR
jgi:hypothetical protein